MSNHVHLIVVPADPDGLRATFAHAHRRYTGFINARHRWTGHLWQGRFGAVAMDEQHLAAAARYVALNPVRARLVERAEDWEWSSARAHLRGTDDPLVTVAPLLDRLGDFAAFLGRPEDQQATRALRRGESTGRPAASEAWIKQIERSTGRALLPRKPGRKPRAGPAESEGIGALWRLSP